MNNFCPPPKKHRRKFWFCYVDGKSTPAHKHYTVIDARQEAERLARQCRLDVFVLGASEFARYIPPAPSPDIEWQRTIE